MIEQPSHEQGAKRNCSRREFLGLLAAGAALLTGCSVPGRKKERPTYRGAVPDEGEGDTLTPEITPAPISGRQASIVDCDVCVVGGGAAGMAAATAAARLDAQTVLLEESFAVGGNVTRGLVSLDKIAYGGPPMVAGYFRELVGRLAEQGDAVYPSKATQYSVPYDPDALRHTALLLLREAGAQVHFGTQATWTELDRDRITAVWAQQQGAMIKVRAGTYIDCTGDGNLGYLAGNGYWLGDRTHGQIQGQTLIFHAAPVDFERLRAFARKEGSLTNEYQVIGLRSAIKRLRKEKRLSGPGQDGLLINRKMDSHTVSISGSQVYGNHLSPDGLADILAVLERQDYELLAGLKAEVPGFEGSRLVRLAERPYLREGRRLAGRYQLTAGDVLAARKFKDAIARGWYPIDLHVAYGQGRVHFGQVPAGDWYEIPYRSLVARDIDNLLMAGRCISATHEALGSTRISPLSMAQGQAAGIAAALCTKKSKRPADVSVSDVRRLLADRGALL